MSTKTSRTQGLTMVTYISTDPGKKEKLGIGMVNTVNWTGLRITQQAILCAQPEGLSILG